MIGEIKIERKDEAKANKELSWRGEKNEMN
jgi:hypothetical protein